MEKKININKEITYGVCKRYQTVWLLSPSRAEIRSIGGSERGEKGGRVRKG